MTKLTNSLPPMISSDPIVNETKKLPSYVHQLNGGACHIVVLGNYTPPYAPHSLPLGDAKSGKSSFLNYLLGNEILTSKVEHCTSTITEVHYGEEFKVNVCR
jgi:hypothetical protein